MNQINYPEPATFIREYGTRFDDQESLLSSLENYIDDAFGYQAFSQERRLCVERAESCFLLLSNENRTRFINSLNDEERQLLGIPETE